jgi:glutamate racemase
MIYFGDTAHLPYGTKSPATVRKLTVEHLLYLGRRGMKCAVIACNTASAVALQSLRARLKVPVLGVIAPGAREALRRTRNGRIGVIGTATTIASKAYELALRRLDPELKVTARACPLFVPLIEEGLVRHRLARIAARMYLKPLIRAGVDTVVMGCTHYPLMRGVLGKILGPRVYLVDSATAVRLETERKLGELGILRRGQGRGRASFFLTDTGGSFPKVALRFLREAPDRLIQVRV